MKALLIAGDARYFLDEVVEFRQYLTQEVGVKDIELIATAYLTQEEMQRRLIKALDVDRANGPLLIFYCGHGGEGMWGISFRQGIHYDTLARLLEKYPEPVMFINDCCYAFSVVSSFEAAGVSPEKVSLIAAVKAEDKVEPGIMWRLLRSWREKKAHAPSLLRFIKPLDLWGDSSGDKSKLAEEYSVPTPEKRWGAEFDYLFYPTRNVILPQREIPVITIDGKNFSWDIEQIEVKSANEA